VHAAGCDFWPLKRSRPFYTKAVYPTAYPTFNLRNASQHHKKQKKKRLPAGPKMEQDPQQKSTNTQKDTTKGHAGLLPEVAISDARQREAKMPAAQAAVTPSLKASFRPRISPHERQNQLPFTVRTDANGRIRE
jgi:hypothetical protein